MPAKKKNDANKRASRRKPKAKVASVAIAFVPVIHRGYVDFFKKHPKLLVIGEEFYSEFPKLERDIRSLAASDIAKALQSLGLSVEVELLTKASLRELPKAAYVMPHDELSQSFAEKYLARHEVAFENIFLRWNRFISQAELQVAPDRKVSRDAFDREMIALANKEAVRSADWYRQIGAVAVRKGKVLFTRFIKYLPTELSQDVYGNPRSNYDAGEVLKDSPIAFSEMYTSIHSEAGIVTDAARKGVSLDGSVMYSTTFPCPQCAKLIAEAGIRKVYYQKGYSLLDAERILKAYGIEIILVD